MDKYLFAYNMIVPYDRKWTGWIDVDKVPQEDQQQLVTELQALFQIANLAIGKTEAKAKGELIEPGLIRPSVGQSEKTKPDRGWTITLQSHAILCDPRTLGTGTPIHGACSDLFSEFFNNNVHVTGVFARQSLVGAYLANRYQRPGVPFLLFEPGSTFVVQPHECDLPAGEETVESWLRGGLPFPRWAEERYQDAVRKVPGSHWSRCPFIPQNGYGAVCSNLDLSWIAS